MFSMMLKAIDDTHIRTYNISYPYGMSFSLDLKMNTC